uniref:Macaca fascicularis brain cDNA clone: QflA-19456, similar to human CD8 antigen, alpha polypeptide (p32) (CD8A),transcript variant 2, mRNA, RefSeq: NM_171827.1 n=1 Tax=Macaca fascicularis TaxID=9541 RepID=I7GLV3_MACFA|nr:unnamed protein product [Macaca fascicularis]
MRWVRSRTGARGAQRSATRSRRIGGLGRATRATRAVYLEGPLLRWRWGCLEPELLSRSVSCCQPTPSP